MSRIDVDECKHMDMEWYSVDRQNDITMFCSGGKGNLPEFIRENEEKADELIVHSDRSERITGSVIIFSKAKIGRTEQVTGDFSDKELYYFDADDGTRLGVCTSHRYCTKHSTPQNPPKYGLLPKHVREILEHNFVEIEDFSFTDTIHVRHAYIR